MFIDLARRGLLIAYKTADKIVVAENRMVTQDTAHDGAHDTDHVPTMKPTMITMKFLSLLES